MRKALFFHYPRRAFKHTGQKKIFSALQVNTALCKTIEKTLLNKLAKILFLDVDDTAWYAQETRNKGVEIHNTELEGYKDRFIRVQLFSQTHTEFLEDH